MRLGVATVASGADRLDAVERFAGVPRRALVLRCCSCGRRVLVLGGDREYRQAEDDGCPACRTRSLFADGEQALTSWGQP